MKSNASANNHNAVVFTGIAAAVLIAASTPENFGQWSIVGNYIYWLVRIGIEGAMFVLALEFLERSLTKKLSLPQKITIAIVATHIPFVLAVTAMDIVLGLPELGIGTQSGSSGSRFGAFVWELLYLADNHVALCLLLCGPRLMWHFLSNHVETSSSHVSLLSALTPPLEGEIYWVEAQEHYVRVTTSKEKRMVLNRFSDVINDLTEKKGLQVHRSHWVAMSAIEDVEQNGQSMQLRLITGDSVPVSRSYRKATQTALGL